LVLQHLLAALNMLLSLHAEGCQMQAHADCNNSLLDGSSFNE